MASSAPAPDLDFSTVNGTTNASELVKVLAPDKCDLPSFTKKAAFAAAKNLLSEWLKLAADIGPLAKGSGVVACPFCGAESERSGSRYVARVLFTIAAYYDYFAGLLIEGGCPRVRHSRLGWS